MTSLTDPAQTRHTSPGSVEVVDEGQRVLERLRRIDSLDRETTPPDRLLGELRALLGEAESWVRSEAAASASAHVAVDSFRDALEAPLSAVPRA